MKRLHRSDLFGWSVFNEERNLDFHSVLWTRAPGNVAIDPLPLSEHDRAHLKSLGDLSLILVTNSDHVRGAAELRDLTGARLAGPRGEEGSFPLGCDLWLSDGDEPVPGMRAFALEGSKTPGELAFVLGDTLITGDLIRSHQAGTLCLLPDAKLRDRSQAIASVQRLPEHAGSMRAVLVGDGWPIFRDGGAALRELAHDMRVHE